MDNLIERGMLFDFYGELLTEHQQKIYSAVVSDDLSLSELSEETGISRQGIHDLIRRCDRILEGYEDKLRLVERFRRIRGQIKAIDERIDSDGGLSAESKAELKAGLKEILGEL